MALESLRSTLETAGLSALAAAKARRENARIRISNKVCSVETEKAQQNCR